LYVRVVSQGVGVSDAEVSAWDDRQLLGRGASDVEGRVRINGVAAVGRAGRFVTARRLGFAPARQMLVSANTARGDTLTVELVRVAASLPALAVREGRLRCPRESEAPAEALWRAAASHYAAGQSRLYFGYDETVAEDELVPPEARGYGDAMVRHRRLTVPPDDIYRLLLASPPPYAAYERHVTLMGEYWKWRYAALHQFAAGHFATDAFRARHVLTVLDVVDGNTTLGFCPMTRDETEIQGELVIGPDSLFRSGKWTYLVPHDCGDDAGAEAVFGTSYLDGAQLLVAVQGSTWRREGRDQFRQSRFALSSWKFGRIPSDALP
jgi:hypothetical protein